MLKVLREKNEDFEKLDVYNEKKTDFNNNKKKKTPNTIKF